MEDRLRELKDERFEIQKKIDYHLAQVTELTSKKKLYTFRINKLKRLINETAKEDEGRGSR